MTTIGFQHRFRKPALLQTGAVKKILWFLSIHWWIRWMLRQAATDKQQSIEPSLEWFPATIGLIALIYTLAREWVSAVPQQVLSYFVPKHHCVNNVAASKTLILRGITRQYAANLEVVLCNLRLGAMCAFTKILSSSFQSLHNSWSKQEQEKEDSSCNFAL